MMADFRDLEVCDRKDSTEFGFLNVLGVTVATNVVIRAATPVMVAELMCL